jgi:predicted PurR-regulated permease PerM
MIEIEPTTEREPRTAKRTVLEGVLFSIAAVFALWLFYSLRAVLLLLAITVIFCYLLAPLVDFIESPGRNRLPRFRLPRSLAILIVYLLLACLLFVLIRTMAPLLSEQLSGFFENAPEYARLLDRYSKRLAALPGNLTLPLSWREWITGSLDGAKAGIIEWLQAVALRTVYAVKYLPWLALIPLIGFFFLKDYKTLTEKLLSTLPRRDSRYRATLLLQDVSGALAGYMRGQVLACLLVGVIEGLGLWAIGLNYPIVFGAAAAVFEFVPILGPFLLGLIAVLVASYHSGQYALVVFLFLAIFRVIHDYFIFPRLIGRSVEVHPLAIILAVLCGVELGGVIGAFLSIPVATLLIVSLRHWRYFQFDRESPLIGVDQTRVDRRLNDVR